MENAALRSVVFTTLAATAHAHAGVFIPPARNADDRFLPAFQNGKSPATPCTCANGLPTVSPPKHPESKNGECDMGLRSNGGGQPCLWWWVNYSACPPMPAQT